MPKKIDLAHAFAAAGDYPVSLVASTLGVERSTLFDRVTGWTRTRGPYTKAGDADLLPRIRQIAAQRPTYGDRRIAAVLNRQQRTAGLAPVNHKRVYRIMAADRLLPARRYTENGPSMGMMALRWRSARTCAGARMAPSSPAGAAPSSSTPTPRDHRITRGRQCGHQQIRRARHHAGNRGNPLW